MLDFRGLNVVNLKRINMVTMTMTGRHLLNSSIEQNDWNFDMLTKRDLILIWNKWVNTKKKGSMKVNSMSVWSEVLVI